MVDTYRYHAQEKKISFRLSFQQYQGLQELLDFHGIGRIKDSDILSDKMRMLIEILNRTKTGKPHPQINIPTETVEEDEKAEPEKETTAPTVTPIEDTVKIPEPNAETPKVLSDSALDKSVPGTTQNGDADVQAARQIGTLRERSEKKPARELRGQQRLGDESP